MTKRERPLLAAVKDQIGSLAADVRQMVVLRWQLARLELRAAVRPIKRLAIAWLVAGIVTLTALSVLAVAVAGLLGSIGRNGWLGLSFVGWLLLIGVGLLLGGIAGGYLAWRRFRRRFVGLEQTLEELREDLVWLREWAGRSDEESRE